MQTIAEVGLTKTIQSIPFCKCELMRRNVGGPFGPLVCSMLIGRAVDVGLARTKAPD